MEFQPGTAPPEHSGSDAQQPPHLFYQHQGLPQQPQQLQDGQQHATQQQHDRAVGLQHSEPTHEHGAAQSLAPPQTVAVADGDNHHMPTLGTLAQPHAMVTGVSHGMGYLPYLQHQQQQQQPQHPPLQPLQTQLAVQQPPQQRQMAPPQLPPELMPPGSQGVSEPQHLRQLPTLQLPQQAVSQHESQQSLGVSPAAGAAYTEPMPPLQADAHAVSQPSREQKLASVQLMLPPHIPEESSPADDAVKAELQLPTEGKPGKKRKQDGQASAEGPVKRTRSKKPVGAPTRPRSAFMFFLAEFREKFKQDHPDIRKVSDMAQHAGEAWRTLGPAERARFEEASAESKAQYAVKIAEFEAQNPRPPRQREKPKDPSELQRPQSAYFFFLTDFRKRYREEHADERTPMKVLGRIAGNEWNSLSEAAKAPYVVLSNHSKAEYRRLKQLTPAERLVDHAVQQAQSRGVQPAELQHAAAQQGDAHHVGDDRANGRHGDGAVAGLAADAHAASAGYPPHTGVHSAHPDLNGMQGLLDSVSAAEMVPPLSLPPVADAGNSSWNAVAPEQHQTQDVLTMTDAGGRQNVPASLTALAAAADDANTNPAIVEGQQPPPPQQHV